MADLISKVPEYNQSSFIGGMNLLGDDSRLQPTQYRAGFDLTNRYDVLDPVLASVRDVNAPAGIKQELVTFGNYVICFASGLAYYRYYTDVIWTPIVGFKMDANVPRYWTATVPVAVTNYGRIPTASTQGTVSNGVSTLSNQSSSSLNPVVSTPSLSAAFGGNTPGLLVQDNINQPRFIFIGPAGYPQTRITQTYAQWSAMYDLGANSSTYGTLVTDEREYVPIGQCMAWVDGILYITSQDGNTVYRSVSGRPLDFVIAVDLLGQKAGDATYTSYSVGVGGITCLRQCSAGGVLITANNALFQITKNTTPGAPTEFGEYTFIRTFLFNSTCLSDRAIIDTLGDTRFIDLTGVRSFNAVEQLNNEGRNTAFTANIQGAFGPDSSPITQDPLYSAAILYNNYELYAVNTIFGPAICKYDTINSCWTSFELQQTGDKRVKILAKIELTVQRLYAVTEDDQIYTLYLGPKITVPSFRSIGVCSNLLYINTNVKMANPKLEVKLQKTRVILNKITNDCTCTFTPYVNNRQAIKSSLIKGITYEAPATPTTNITKLLDTDTQLVNLLYTTTDCNQGWKIFGVFSWTGGSFTQFSMEMMELTPNNPENSQELTK